MTEHRLTTKVQVLNLGGLRKLGTATLELRGDALVFHYARKNCLVTRCLSLRGATRELRPHYPYRVLYLGLPTAVLLLILFGPLSARVGVDIGSPALHFLIEFAVLAAGLVWLTYRFPTPAIEFRFNTEDVVFSLVVKDNRSENESLSQLAQRLHSFELQHHEYRHEPSAILSTVLPFARQRSTIIDYSIIVVSPAIPISLGYSMHHHSPRLALFLYFMAPIYTAINYYRFRLAKYPNSDPADPAELSTVRNALNLLADVEDSCAIGTLASFLKENPDATNTRKLLAQIYVDLAQYDEALALFHLLPESDTDTMREFSEKIRCFKKMTRAGAHSGD